MSKTVLVDLDGTLCDTSKREHLLDAKPRDWVAYSAACGSDTIIEEVHDVVVGLRAMGYSIVLVTGRGDGAEEQTRTWLYAHGIHYDLLVMRPKGEYCRNPELKAKAVAELTAAGYNIVLAIDDHPGVAKVYADAGIPTLVVARPNADKGILTEVAEGLSDQTTDLPPFVAEAISEARATFAKKNADYAEDGAWRSNFDCIADQMGIDAVAACDTLIAVKQARLRSLTINGRDPANESVVDTYLDRMVYSIIAYALLLDERTKTE